MADRLKEGYSDASDDGGNKTLRGFVLIRKNHGEKNRSMAAVEHSGSTIYKNTYMYYAYKFIGT